MDLKKNIIKVIGITCGLVLVMYVSKIIYSKTGQNHQSAEKNAVISWQEANKNYGKYVTVEGTIASTYNSGKVCFLNFHQNYKKYLSVVIFASSFHLFPPQPEKYYYGKKVRVKGLIKEYKGKPEIIVNNPLQIEIIE